MIIESFISILFVDDKLNEEISTQIILDKGIDSFPINYFGITDINKDELSSKVKCFRYNRKEGKFDFASEEMKSISDFSIIFIDYQLEKKNGIEVKNYFYDIELALRPKLILLSGLEREAIQNEEATKTDALSVNKFQGYIAKDANHFLFKDLIYSSIDDIFKIEETIFVSNVQEGFSHVEPFNLNFSDLLNSSTKEISRLWISRSKRQVSLICKDNNDDGIESVNSFINSQDSVFVRNYELNEEGSTSKTNNVSVELYRDFGHEINFSAFQAEFNIGNFIHKYVSFVINESLKKPSQDYIIDSLFLSTAYQQRIDQMEFKTSELNKYLINERKCLIQLVFYEENSKSNIIELGILIKAPRVSQEVLFYENHIHDLIEILGNQKYIHGSASASLITPYKINDDYEYYKLKITVSQTAGVDNDNLKKRVNEIIYDVYSYIGSIVKDSLDQSISIFDLIGPSIVGPSSSHTCGANRIGRLALKLIEYYLIKEYKTIPEGSEILISARLHDSFRKTGKGHKTYNALPAGLIDDLEKDHDGLANREKGPNIAEFPYEHVKTKKVMLLNQKEITLKWIGYNELNDSQDPIYNIPLPKNYPLTSKNSIELKPDLHENAAAIFIKIKNGDEKIIFDSDWTTLNLVIIGESIGGGKIQIKAVGGKWIRKDDSLFENKWDFYPLLTREEIGFYFYKNNSKFKEKGLFYRVQPLNGTTFPFYNINNIENYPPNIGVNTMNQNLSFTGFNDLEKIFDRSDTINKFLELIYNYEYWHLTGININENKTNQDIMQDYNAVKKIIFDEAQNMFNILKESQEEIVGFIPNPGFEFQNIGNNYAELCHDKIDGFKSIFSAANFGAITAMIKNAHSMRILAAPTGGACGVLPGVLSAINYQFEIDKKVIKNEDFVNALLISGFLAAISSNWVSPSGAALGCQAETGTGSAMGASFACFLMGGKPKQIIQAYILALKNSLGLVCDPVAGRVNTPCIKRNGFKSVEAINAAYLSLAGVTSFIPGDEILMAMREIGLDMQAKYRETSEGGLAKTPKGLKEKYLNRTNYCHQL